MGHPTTESDRLMTRDGEIKTVETQTVAGRHLAELILEYARDLRRNSSGGDDYPWEYAKGTAGYLEELVRRSGVKINMDHAVLTENVQQALSVNRRARNNVGYPIGTQPHIVWKHVDGPLLRTSDGQFHWLTWRERLRLFLGLADIHDIDFERRR